MPAVVFDSDDLDAAYAELDLRYAAGEAAPYAGVWETSQRFLRAVAARDWEQLASAFSEDFVSQDHRLLGWGTSSRDELVVQLRAMVELAPDVRLRGDHALAINRRGTLEVVRRVGSRDGGAFENDVVSVTLPGPDGRIRRLHTYDLDQLDAARACFDALTAEPPARASRTRRRALRTASSMRGKRAIGSAWRSSSRQDSAAATGGR